MQSSTQAPAPTPFADATALGLFGLAIGCASLLPIAFGVKEAMTVDALRTCSWFCLLFGAGCQFLAGLMSFANKNGIGGTLLTTFSFNWVMNWWALSSMAEGKAVNPAIVFAVDCTFLVIFLVMTAAFGYFSRLLFLFLLDIDLLYTLRILKELTHSPAFAMPIALTTVALMAIALYIAFSLVLATASGKVLLPIGGPMWTPATPAPTPGAPASGASARGADGPASSSPASADGTQRIAAMN